MSSFFSLKWERATVTGPGQVSTCRAFDLFQHQLQSFDKQDAAGDCNPSGVGTAGIYQEISGVYSLMKEANKTVDWQFKQSLIYTNTLREKPEGANQRICGTVLEGKL
jgi:hypothetical protein